MSNQTIEPPVVAQRLAGKHLTFVLGREHYGVPVFKVREIIRLCDIVPLPQMPDYIKGVLNLRGRIIPVVDLRVKFGLTTPRDTELACIMVVEVVLSDKSASLMGVIVDAVEDVVNISDSDIEQLPEFGAATAADYILGLAKIKGSVKALIDIDRVLTLQTVEHVRKFSASQVMQS